ncbi:MAG: NAD(P)-dependent oxidoreductase [Clostridiales bacterium]|nr:NAD(P)-dependent oxidoreductase [Clostridiales bacterium]
MDEKELIRYIPRRYFRGDCSSSYICIAATDDQNVNIAISDECKAKRIQGDKCERQSKEYYRVLPITFRK